MKRKTIVTILIIILIGIMITDFKVSGPGVFELFFRRMETESIHRGGFNITTNSDYKYETNRELLLEGTNKKDLIINNQLGSVDIVGEDRNDISVKAEITVYSSEEKAAESYGKKIKLNLKEKTDQIILNEINQNIPENINGVIIDYTIKAPHKIYLDIENQHGSLNVRNFTNGASLSNKYKDSRIKNIKGKNINISVKYGNLDLSNINSSQTVKVDTAYNGARIENIKANLELDSSYAKTDINNIGGFVNANFKYGEAELEETGELEFDAKYIDINLDNIKGSITGDLKYGEIRINDVNYAVDLESQYTDVVLRLSPEISNFELNFNAEYGNIKSDFPLGVKKNDKYRTVNYKQGNGDVKIDVETEHADIKFDIVK